jgi:hypothetical protein
VALATVAATPEDKFRLGVEDLAFQARFDFCSLTPSRPRAAANCPIQFPDRGLALSFRQVRKYLMSADRVEQLVTEVAQVEQEQPTLYPSARP